MASPMLARTTMSDITIISSMSVNPEGSDPEARRSIVLPVPILRPIECRALVPGVHVEDVLGAPCRGRRRVLIGPQAPLRRARHRVDWDAPQELQLAARRVVGRRDPFDQRLQIGRIALVLDR